MWSYNRFKSGEWTSSEQFKTREEAIENGRKWAKKEKLKSFFIGKVEYIEQPTFERTMMQIISCLEEICLDKNQKDEKNKFKYVMEKLIKWQDKNGVTVIHCSKEEERVELFDIFGDNCFTWIYGKEFKVENWDSYKESTCYSLNNKTKKISFDLISKCLEEGYTIRPFSKLIKGEK